MGICHQPQLPQTVQDVQPVPNKPTENTDNYKTCTDAHTRGCLSAHLLLYTHPLQMCFRQIPQPDTCDVLIWVTKGKSQNNRIQNSPLACTRRPTSEHPCPLSETLILQIQTRLLHPPVRDAPVRLLRRLQPGAAGRTCSGRVSGVVHARPSCRRTAAELNRIRNESLGRTSDGRTWRGLSLNLLCEAHARTHHCLSRLFKIKAPRFLSRSISF